jgi:myo-inositol-1(or 4)-monophosphatase
LRGVRRVFDQARLARWGGDCYNYCLLAAGHIDLVIEASLSAYDILALVPLIEEAGGVITTWEGKPVTDGGRVVAAGDRRVHETVLEMLAGVNAG